MVSTKVSLFKQDILLTLSDELAMGMSIATFKWNDVFSNRFNNGLWLFAIILSLNLLVTKEYNS